MRPFNPAPPTSLGVWLPQPTASSAAVSMPGPAWNRAGLGKVYWAAGLSHCSGAGIQPQPCSCSLSELHPRHPGIWPWDDCSGPWANDATSPAWPWSTLDLAPWTCLMIQTPGWPWLVSANLPCSPVLFPRLRLPLACWPCEPNLSTALSLVPITQNETRLTQIFFLLEFLCNLNDNSFLM